MLVIYKKFQNLQNLMFNGSNAWIFKLYILTLHQNIYNGKNLYGADHRTGSH